MRHVAERRVHGTALLIDAERFEDKCAPALTVDAREERAEKHDRNGPQAEFAGVADSFLSARGDSNSAVAEWLTVCFRPSAMMKSSSTIRVVSGLLRFNGESKRNHGPGSRRHVVTRL